jgi:hypothetical protein
MPILREMFLQIPPCRMHMAATRLAAELAFFAGSADFLVWK